MPPDLLRARRRALIVMLVVAIAPLLGGAGALDARSMFADPRLVQSALIEPLHASLNETTKVAPHIKASPRTAVDTGSVHDGVRSLVNRFQDLWRSTWQESELARHAPVDSRIIAQKRDLESGNYTPDVRRYLAIQCIAGSPDSATIENALASPTVMGATNLGVKSSTSALGVNTKVRLSIATGNMIVPRPNYGPICPNWLAPDAPVPADESEGLDNALPVDVRIPIEMSRDTLIEKLSALLTQYPNDDWIAGQLVRFTMDQRVPKNSVAASRRCKAATILCASLQGLALEQAKSYALAEASFRRADSIAAALPREKNALCIDESALLVLPVRSRGQIRNAGCGEQQTLVNRLWWLSDPLWGVPGNERYVAHGSRVTSVALRSIVRRDERYVWDVKNGGSAVREVVIRYGWPSYTYWAGRGLDNEIQVILEKMPARERQAPYTAKEYLLDQTALVPQVDAVTKPTAVTNDAWDLWRPQDTKQDQWWAPEHMKLRTHIAPMNEGQQVMWRRNSEIMYQLAVDDPLAHLDTMSKGESRAVLWGGANPDATRKFSETLIVEGSTLRLGAKFPSVPLVLSAEILPRTLSEQAQRNRFGVTPPPTLREMKSGEFALSDPVFMRMPNHDVIPPTDEASVMRYMAGGVEFPASEPVALYWESYGFVPGDTVQVELKIRRDDDVNVARRIGALLRVASPLRDSVSIKWTEPDARHSATSISGVKPVVGRAVSLDLKALSAGYYVVIIEMRKGANISARSERRFAVTGP